MKKSIRLMFSTLRDPISQAATQHKPISLFFKSNRDQQSIGRHIHSHPHRILSPVAQYWIPIRITLRSRTAFYAQPTHDKRLRMHDHIPTFSSRGFLTFTITTSFLKLKVVPLLQHFRTPHVLRPQHHRPSRCASWAVFACAYPARSACQKTRCSWAPAPGSRPGSRWSRTWCPPGCGWEKMKN